MTRRHLTIIGTLAAVTAVTAGLLVGAGGATPTKPATPAVSAAAVTGAQDHSRNPRAAERRAITAAARGVLKPVERGKFRVVEIKISARTPFWATAALTPTQRYRNTLTGTHMVLVKSRVNGRWTVLDNDQGEGVGCGIAPMKILDEVAGGAVCPPKWRL